MAALLEETALTSLAPLLSGETLHGLSGLLSEEDGGSRVTLLTHLRKMGIARIGDRQTLANCLGRAHRLGRICVSTPEAPAARVAVEEEAEATGSAHASGEDVDASVAAHLQGSFYSANNLGAPGRSPSSAPPSSISAMDMSAAPGASLRVASHEPARERPVRLDELGLGAPSALVALHENAPCAVVLCHPHPARGGDMYNPFVSNAFLMLSMRGISTLRLNFSTLPGPEASDEVDGDKAQLQLNRAEASAAVRLLRAKSASGTPIVLLGYSWGALVALGAAREEPESVQGVALVSPPINEVPTSMQPGRGDFARWPVLLATGDEDEFCSVGRLREIAGAHATTLVVLPKVAHYLRGEEGQAMATQVAGWVTSLTFAQ